MNRLKSEFVSNISHEMRTLLNGILGLGHMLQVGTVRPDSPKFTSYIDRIIASGKHLLGLIDQVLDYVKIEAGKMDFVVEPVNVPRALAEVVDALKVVSRARRIAIQVDVAPDVEAVVTDPLRLRQMLLALVDNAIKFSHEGGSVELVARPVDAVLWQVVVTDHGIGISQADVLRLFSSFVQLSSGLTKEYEGTRIGLALTRRIAIAQGGNVEVQSQPGQGSAFVLTLARTLRSGFSGAWRSSDELRSGSRVGMKCRDAARGSPDDLWIASWGTLSSTPTRGCPEADGGE